MRAALIMAAVMALTLGGCSGGPRPGDRPLAANPSAFVAAELAFARAAQDKGQWTAFRETAAKDAQMFVPQRVLAQDWLKGRADPPRAVAWQPHAVFSSCDGSAGATTGAWQGPGGTHGYFTTIWARMADGQYRWLLDHGAPLKTARREGEFIQSRQATCGTRPPVAISAAEAGADMKTGVARDQTLSWTSVVQPDGARRVTVTMWDGAAMQPVISDAVSAADAAAM